MVLKVEQFVYLAPGCYTVAEVEYELSPEMLRIIFVLLRYVKA